MPRCEPYRKCKFQRDWYYQSLYEKHLFECDREDCGYICMEDWRKKKRDCKMFEDIG
jgi:hypothetical protein